MNQPEPTTNMKTCKQGIVLDGDYYIAWERCNTFAKITTWVLHLSEKTEWVSTAMLGEFVETAMRYHRLDRANI